MPDRSPRSRRTFRPLFERLEDRIVLAITWPVPGTHEMQNGFAGGTPNNAFKFHEGIDIRADGTGGQEVVVARKGKVYFIDRTAQGGMVTIKVDGIDEWDTYIHVTFEAGLAKGDDVDVGERLGTVSTTFHPSGGRHLHLDIVDEAPDPVTGIVEESSFVNPFLRFEAANDRDPLGNTPLLRDTNGDDKKLLITQSGDPAAVFAKQPIKGDVDIIADAVDPMSTDLGFVANPHIIGYWIEPRFWLMHGVKNFGAPYLLAKFDDNWFDGTTAQKTSDKFGEVYDTTRPADIGTFPFQRLDHFIVSNTKGEDGAIGNVDGSQYWNTNAKDDSSSSTVAHANFAGKPDATKNAEARFFDGELNIHVVLGDVVNTNENLKAGKVRLDNFIQTAVPGHGGIPSPGGAPIMLYEPDTTPYVPDLVPEPVIADVSEKYLLNEVVGVSGEEYYPDFAMTAYVVHHRPEGWMEDDSLTSGLVAQVVVQSDSNGSVPLTEAWLADLPGKYDIIIDYDNDGLFSWTLDGVGGFHVNSPPVGNPDHYTIHTGDVLEVAPPGVLINDTDADGDPLTAVPHMGPGGGTLFLYPDGSFWYQSYLETVGMETFVYLAFDGCEYSDFVTVTIDVTNTLPVAEDDFYATAIDTPLSIDAPGVLENDSDADGDFLSASFSNTTDGSVVLNADGSFVYTPSPGFTGTASFAYLLSDEHSNTVTGTVSITVGNGLMLDEAPDPAGATELQMVQLVMLNDFAIDRWRAAGVSDETLSTHLSGLRFQIVDLPGSLLAVAGEDGTISIDIDGAGHGWFLDTTPRDDDEFRRWVSKSERRAVGRSPAADDVDLLTVLTHEVGHLLGLDHADGDATNVMADILSLGTRRNPTTWDAAIVEYLYSQNRKRRW